MELSKFLIMRSELTLLALILILLVAEIFTSKEKVKRKERVYSYMTGDFGLLLKLKIF